MLRFLGGDPLGTAAFATSMVLALIALVCTGISSSTALPGAFKAGLCAALGTILAMVVTRHELRNFYLEKLIAPDKVPVNTQWDLLTVFILSAVALGVYITWLIKLVWKGADNAAALSASSPGLESAGARD
jgi:multisubunit Na+/H+ antiporter MnhB subunit